MKFVCQMNNDKYICIPADEIIDNISESGLFIVKNKGNVVGAVDCSVVLEMHLAEEGTK